MPRSRAKPTIPSDNETKIAHGACSALEQRRSKTSRPRLQLVLSGDETVTVELPEAVLEPLRQMLAALSAGSGVAVVPIETEISTQQAAEILRVSRPYVVGLIDKGILPARSVGPQRRVLLSAILKYQIESRAKRRETLRKLAAYDQELELDG